MNSLIKDINHILQKIKSLGQLPEGAILCTIDVVGLHLNIQEEESIALLKRFVDAMVDTPYVGKAKTKFGLWFNNYKSKVNLFK